MAGKDPDLNVSFADAVVGYDFVKTMKLNLKEGRDFSKDFGTDSASYLLNETAVKKMVFKTRWVKQWPGETARVQSLGFYRIFILILCTRQLNH